MFTSQNTIIGFLKGFSALIALIAPLSLGSLSIDNDINYREASDTLKMRRLSGIQHAQSLERFYAAKLDKLKFPVRSENDPVQGSSKDEQKCKALVYRALMALPQEHRNSLQELKLTFDSKSRRGLAGSGSLVLRCSNVSDAELVGVLIHEMGHLVDEQFLVGQKSAGASSFYDFGKPLYANDPSLDFYKISWESDRARRADSEVQDFASSYSTTDPFEDFAEAYAYYVLHGAEFRQLSVSNDSLNAKYDILKNAVFDGAEFENFSTRVIGKNRQTRDYDVTVLPYRLQLFLGASLS